MTIRLVCLLFVVCCVGSDLCDELVTRSEESCRVCYQGMSRSVRPRPDLGCCAAKIKVLFMIFRVMTPCRIPAGGPPFWMTLLTSPGFMWAKLGKCHIIYNWCETDGSHKTGVASQLKLYPQPNFELYNQCQQDLLQGGAHYLCVNWPDCVMINFR